MVLGIRCSNKDFTFALLSGPKNSPKLVRTETRPIPSGYSGSQKLYWLFQETTDLLGSESIDRIVIKRFEGRFRGKEFEERVELEAAVMVAAGAKGIKGVLKKGKSTIAKDLGQKGRARYLADVDTSSIPDFDDLPEKQQEAIQAGWSALT